MCLTQLSVPLPVPTKATGNSRSGIPGNREFPGIADPQNSRREFPGISEILAGIAGNFVSFVFFPIFIADQDISVFNLTAPFEQNLE